MSTEQGWALGNGELLATADGGASWTELPSPPAGAAHIRFATADIGYAWSTSGSLWITTNGATSWRPGGQTQVISLETAAGWVWSLAGPQPYPTIWRAPIGSTTWTNLGPTPDRSATLTVHGDVAYVVGQQGAGPIAPSLEVFTGTQPAHHELLPCGQGQTYVPFAPLGVSTDDRVYLVCNVMNPRPSPPTRPAGLRVRQRRQQLECRPALIAAAAGGRHRDGRGGSPGTPDRTCTRSPGRPGRSC